MSFNNLPLEIIQEILYFLDPRYLVAMTHVNKIISKLRANNLFVYNYVKHNLERMMVIRKNNSYWNCIVKSSHIRTIPQLLRYKQPLIFTFMRHCKQFMIDIINFSLKHLLD
jgi:hypothetical protein